MRIKNKTALFARNIGLTATAAVGVAWGTSELADLFTDNGKIIGAISTASQYVAALGTFLPLHALGNRDVYVKEGGGFNWKEFIGDNLKFNVPLFVLDAVYLVGRPLIQDAFIDEGYEASRASLATDGIVVTSYLAAMYPLAKVSGIIRKPKKNLEGELEK